MNATGPAVYLYSQNRLRGGGAAKKKRLALSGEVRINPLIKHPIPTARIIHGHGDPRGYRFAEEHA